MSFTLLPPPLESTHIFFALPAMNGPLPAELKFREIAGSYVHVSLEAAGSFTLLLRCDDLIFIFSVTVYFVLLVMLKLQRAQSGKL